MSLTEERARLVLHGNEQQLIDLIRCEQSGAPEELLTRRLGLLRMHSNERLGEPSMPPSRYGALLCPGTSFLTPHAWECPFQEDPYWLCRLCGQQSEDPAGLGSSSATLSEAMPGLRSKALSASAGVGQHPPATPSPFRIRAAGAPRARLPAARRSPRLVSKHRAALRAEPLSLKSSSRQESIHQSKSAKLELMARHRKASKEAVLQRLKRSAKPLPRRAAVADKESDAADDDQEAPRHASSDSCTTDRSNRKYISKKKQQFLALLRSHQGCPAAPPPADVVQQLRAALPATGGKRADVEAALLHLGLQRFAQDAPYLALQLVGQQPEPLGDKEPLILQDLERLLGAYLKLPVLDSSKRKPLDCAYLLHQLLRHHGLTTATAEPSGLRDRPAALYHDEVYATLSRSLGLSHFPLH